MSVYFDYDNDELIIIDYSGNRVSYHIESRVDNKTIRYNENSELEFVYKPDGITIVATPDLLHGNNLLEVSGVKCEYYDNGNKFIEYISGGQLYERLRLYDSEIALINSKVLSLQE